MLTEQIRARLEQLNRMPLANTAGAADRSVVAKRQAPPVSVVKNGSVRNGSVKTRSVTKTRIDAGEEVQLRCGPHWSIRRPLSAIWPASVKRIAAHVESQRISDDKNNQTTKDRSPERQAIHPELKTLARAFPERAMFLDLETCGFAGSMVFLIGLLRREGQELILEQLLARDYREERSIFQSLWQSAAEHDVLVTFNGKSFDWPMVHDRSTYHRLGRDLRSSPQQTNSATPPRFPPPLTPTDPRPELIHFDLLHHARRKWKETLPNCKLQTLERHLCGRTRTGDIPGSEIPAAYHQYVKTGDPTEIDMILHHNALDLVTLLQVSLRLLSH